MSASEANSRANISIGIGLAVRAFSSLWACRTWRAEWGRACLSLRLATPKSLRKFFLLPKLKSCVWSAKSEKPEFLWVGIRKMDLSSEKIQRIFSKVRFLQRYNFYNHYCYFGIDAG